MILKIQITQIKKSELILIDEVSMMYKHSLVVINRYLQDLINTKHLFGGKTILLGGDFRQSLPMIKSY